MLSPLRRMRLNHGGIDMIRHRVAAVFVCLLGAVTFGCAESTEPEENVADQSDALIGVASPSLVANWRLDENGCGTTAVDASGNGANGTKYEGVGTGTGRIGTAAWFDGVNTRIEIPNRAAFNFTTAMTVSAWVRPQSLGGIQAIVNKWYAKDSFGLAVNEGRFAFTIAVPGGEWGKTYDVFAPAVANTWTHVAGVFDGSSIKIYLNGTLSGTTAVPAGTVLQQSTRPIVIGNHPSWNAYTGYIDEVRLYNNAVPAAQIARLARLPTPAPVAYYRLEECDATVATDTSGNGHTGTRLDGVTSSNTGVGMASNFDGAKARIEIPDTPQLNATSALTLAAWVKPENTAASQTIVNKWYAKDSYMLLVEGGSFHFSIAIPGGEWGKAFTVQAPAVAGTWSHVAGVFDGSSILIYVNGTLRASSAVPAGSILQQSSRPVVIGNHPSWNAFRGSLDEVRIYNAALNSTQVSLIADQAYGW